MKINLKLLTYEPETAAGFPLNLVISHQGKIKQKRIAFSKRDHWLEEEQIISVRHPDYEILMPVLADLKIRSRKIVLQQYSDTTKAYNELFRVDFSDILFLDYYRSMLSEMSSLTAAMLKSSDLQNKNKLLGTIKVYENVLAQFEPFSGGVTLKNIDFSVLNRFKNYQISIGNSKATINLYLRTLRAVYNRGIVLHKFADERPFDGLFKGLTVKSYNSRKKYLDKNSIQLLEAYQEKNEKKKYVDLFLLQFYFGGCDLIDIYYLSKNQLRNGRVIFERSKINTGTLINLKIHPKAQKIINQYAVDGSWVFPWAKEREKYEVFRRTYQRGLIYVQEKLQIEVLPGGGNIGVKVARHTFATMAKRLGIEEDLIRELMGHERNDVDNYYKDKFTEEVRDAALFSVIK